MSEKKEKVAESSRKMVKISKSYNRKVSLKGVTSQYDNIECGTILTILTDFKNFSDIEKKSVMLGKKVRELNEKDMKDAINKIVEMTDDKDNLALVGLGPSLEKKKKIEEDFKEVSEVLEDLEEVEGQSEILTLEEIEDEEDLN